MFTLPLLIGLGARWSADARISQLRADNAELELENASYREATGELAGQIASLQTAMDEIGAKAALDPDADRAMSRLPARVRSRAMGGGSDVGAIVSEAIGASDSPFGVLRGLLGAIENRLANVRTGVERRQALASATPSIWPLTGWISSGFGSRRDPFTGGTDFHPGLDISGNTGQAIQAPADGNVVDASYTGNYGNLVTIDHGFGITTRYAHLSRFAISPGQEVRRGQVIGYVGTTGRSTSSHLHYEVLVNGQLTNPLNLLSGR
ncbi:MAG: M23 family metallopeptidase [Acidobacteriota bacterium]|nr:M23 family metallopeptidase [Acidobacteriota bacterium]